MLAPDKSSSSKRQLLGSIALFKQVMKTQGQRPIPKGPPSTSACYLRNGVLQLQLLPDELPLNFFLFFFLFFRLTGYALRQQTGKQFGSHKGALQECMSAVNPLKSIVLLAGGLLEKQPQG